MKLHGKLCLQGEVSLLPGDLREMGQADVKGWSIEFDHTVCGGTISIFLDSFTHFS